MNLKDTKISVFKTMFENDVPYYITLETAFERIKTGKSKQRVESIRNETDDEKRQVIKRGSVSIVFSGIFTERKIAGLKQHSGLMVLDYDKYKSLNKLNSDLKKITEIPFIVAAFISPSGNGIKAVARIPECDAKEHSRYVKQFHKDYVFEHSDIKGDNVDRICFESYDPDIFINYDAEVYNPNLKDEGYVVSEKVPTLPITDEDKIIEKIMQFDWGKDFREGERNAFIFDIAGMFCEYGINEYTAIGYITNNIVIGDFDESEAERTIKSAYKRRSFGIKYFEDYTKIKRISSDLKNGKDYVVNKYNISEDAYNEIKDDTEHNDFWIITEDKKGKQTIKIDPLKYKLFLERNGFKKYFPHNAQKPTFVEIKSNKVSETSVERIKDFVLDYLTSIGEIDVWSYCASYQNLFSEQFLLMLDTINLMMLKDTKDISYIAFNNGILKVTKDGAELVNFIDVDGYIWESQIIQRDYIKVGNNDNEFKKFVNNISADNPEPIECVIGYLLSTYKNKMNNKAIILNDEVISENPEGGTGKGLFIQGIKQIRKVSILDGKAFDDKKSFPYQTVSQDTNVLVFDDVKKNFDFEQKFSLVTEGLTLERKNKDAIKLSVEESPKIVISTNYAIKGDGNSHNRRRHELEISQYYNGDKTPYDEFGRQLFDDWNIQDFQRFDNYMVRCLQKYLENGLVGQNAKNIKLRKLIASTSMEFYEWVSDRENVKINTMNNKPNAHSDFTNQYPDYSKLHQKTFNIWMQKYASFKGYEYRSGVNQAGRWFELYDGMPTEEVLIDEDPF